MVIFCARNWMCSLPMQVLGLAQGSAGPQAAARGHFSADCLVILRRNKLVETWLRLRGPRANTASANCVWQALGFVAEFQSLTEVQVATPVAAVGRAKFNGPCLHVRGME